MTRFFQQLFLLASVLTTFFGSAGWVKADFLFSYTYSDGAGDVAHGTLDAVASGFADGSLHVISGTLYVTAGANGNSAVGSYSLLPGGPNPQISPSGLFEFDNLIYPANNAGSGVNPNGTTNPSYLTGFGLLFGQPGTGSQQEINIWGNGGSSNYAFYTAVNGGYNIQQGGGGTFTLTAGVPEPSSFLLAGVAGLGLVMGVWWKRKETPAPVSP